LRSLPPNEQETAKTSLEMAHRFRAKMEPAPLKAKLQEFFADRAEVEALAETIKHLTQVVEGSRRKTRREPGARAGATDCRPIKWKARVTGALSQA
jgi:hypothetical protein